MNIQDHATAEKLQPATRPNPIKAAISGLHPTTIPKWAIGAILAIAVLDTWHHERAVAEGEETVIAACETTGHYTTGTLHMDCEVEN